MTPVARAADSRPRPLNNAMAKRKTDMIPPNQRDQRRASVVRISVTMTAGYGMDAREKRER